MAWVILQLSGYKFKIIYRELEFMGLWELAVGCGGCCQAGSGRTSEAAGRIRIGFFVIKHGDGDRAGGDDSGS